MRVAGIIAEYNPMHNGHIYHLQETKRISKADFVVAVMSGDFTQRGEPAVLDKWERSLIAIRNGVDLVLEMPFVYAAASAPDFAYGGVGILEGLGIADTISFGSESADIGKLRYLADFLKNESPEFKTYLRKHLDMGLSFPAARQIAVNECLGMDAGRLLKTPNDILAIEYLMQVRTMTPVAVKREGSYSSAELPDDEHPDKTELDVSIPKKADGKYAAWERTIKTASVSARAVREAVREGQTSRIRTFVPKDTFDALMSVSDTADSVSEKYFDMLRTVILSSETSDLKNIRGMSEGMENRIKKEVRMHADYDSFAQALKSRRYTRTNIDRLLLHVLTGLKKPGKADSMEQTGYSDKAGNAEKNCREEGLYARVLAFNENGARLLKKASEVCSIPIVTNINKYAALPDIVKYDIKASDIYNLIKGRDMYRYSDYVKKPYIGK